MSGTLALECRRVWHRKVKCFLAYERTSVWHSGTGVSCGLAPNPTSVEGSGTHLRGGLGAIRLHDCRTACNHAIRLYHEVFFDCWNACNRAIRLQDFLQ